MQKLPTKKRDSWKFFDEIASTYDPINKVLSVGIDTLWRKNFRKNLPDKQGLVCIDLASGTGDVAIELAKDSRVTHVLGTDLSKEMLEIGKLKVKKRGFDAKINMQIGDGVHIPQKDNSFDVATISFGVRNFEDYKKSLVNVHRILRPGGKVMILEFSLPKNRLVKHLYLFYFRSVLPRIGNILSGHSFAYTYLNKTVESFPYGKHFTDAMEEAGFKNTNIHTLTLGIASFYTGEK